MLLVGKEVVMDNSSKDEYERIAEVYDLFKRDDDYEAFYELIKTTFLNSCEFLRPARTIEIDAVQERSHPYFIPTVSI